MNRKDRRAAGKQGRAAGAGNPLFALALQHHQAGSLFEAENLYRQILAADRRHVGALHQIGIIALQRGQPQAAVDAIGQALALDDRIPECHYNIAFAFQSLGNLNEAVAHYQQAARLRPDYAEAHTNLGNALMQLGRNAEAVPNYERVVAIKPTPETHYNLANALAQAGRLDDAVTQYRRVLALNPDMVGAHNNLANALMEQGRVDEALPHFQRALALDPKLAEPHVNLGNLLLAQGKLEEAAARFEQALRVKADFPDAHANLGNVYLAQGRLENAAQSYRRALALRPEMPEANNNLGIVLAAQGEFVQASRHFELAIARRPDFIDAYNNLARAFLATGQLDNALGVLRHALAVQETAETKGLFVQCARVLPAPPDADDFRSLMVRALDEPWGRANDLARVAAKVLRQTPAVSECIERANRAWPQRLAADELFGPGGIAAICDQPLLRSLLESAPIADLGLERFLTGVRLAMLGIATAGGEDADDRTVEFCCALARQCFLNEYVFAATDEELEAVSALRETVVSHLASGVVIPELRLAALATYVPLGTLPEIERLLDGQWSATLTGVLLQQVREPREERDLRAGIPALTPIENEVSRLVRQQYEENPYPRWTKADPAKKPLPFDQYMRNKFPASHFRPLARTDIDVLIAGCGTGQHAIETTSFSPPAVRVLAIDLSLTSLAYAVRKTREADLHNIDYAQADILKLDAIGRGFDVIESSGVLHHLADPFAGWRVLLGLLRPGGFMAVGLYSEIARAGIVEARAFIAERGYGASADDIRRCRQELIAQDGGERFANVCSSDDFFTTSACRDLLFHVQEHRLTLTQIAAFLAGNDLSFIGFELDGLVQQQYRVTFPDDTAMTDLVSWEAFERAHPSTFSGMYQFWVQKAGAAGGG